jgi:hypothetical protein
MIVEVTRFISEISACLYKFIKYPASTMALSGIVIAMERIDAPTLPRWQRQQFMNDVNAFTGLDGTSLDVLRAVDELRISLDNNVNLQELMRTIDAQCHRGQQSESSKSKDSQMEVTSEPRSPREVFTEDFR